MTEAEILATPLSEIELAELLAAARDALTLKGHMRLRRLAIERDRLLAEVARLRTALEMLSQIQHVSGSAQPAEHEYPKIVDAILAFVDAALAGADLRDLVTVEAIAAGAWKPVATKEKP